MGNITVKSLTDYYYLPKCFRAAIRFFSVCLPLHSLCRTIGRLPALFFFLLGKFYIRSTSLAHPFRHSNFGVVRSLEYHTQHRNSLALSALRSFALARTKFTCENVCGKEKVDFHLKYSVQ